jgi:NADPH-dependent 2,4-dienoyl-CoA reductase/sulfur reductase-like enzyme
MATAAVAQPPQSETMDLNAKIDRIADLDKLPFDPEELQKKYLAERDRRLQHGGGITQYIPVEGEFEHYLEDPWVKPGFTRDPIEEETEVVVIGGGYAAQLAAVKLIEKGVKDIRIIEKAGDFGGTW